ncbi:hypothetical protein GM418_05880 [Maribellus comscasis]|uniref:Uncharacterized protein n=1 Tax=Maribellus comscasis TaxID=2681766 RepID=A0A6I6JK41_9BACT|nr:hypothetical protein [Maribellus comscasis]QGY43205.1 hypothetical protein GM418_05880 [Maribellus comscasis]
MSDQQKNAGFVLSCTFAGMADAHGKATRSCNMSGIRGKDTKSEMPVCLMPAASHVYKNIDRQREFDSGRSRIFYFTISFLYIFKSAGFVLKLNMFYLRGMDAGGIPYLQKKLCVGKFDSGRSRTLPFQYIFSIGIQYLRHCSVSGNMVVLLHADNLPG